ncbi:protein IQ-DOMAIN 32 [Coffea eugenioides]|uniref:protein IQ-DOMAIN 32 n=1 Tax=Coffea eugenioides TaxID=49369 RepID=UPI000F60A496|nr:protein IQ-DOMAIN 32 [Coffea eugenioides]
MVRSGTASCFKLINCAGNNDSVDRDDLQAPESKGSSDRSRWSFRKRSARHRVLSNSVTSETPFVSKTDPDTAAVSLQTQASSTIRDKTSAAQWTEEKNEVQIPVDSKSSSAIASAEDENGIASILDEAIVIVIQSAVRRYLAQRVLLKHKNIIKLQAAVRGHIVRRHAVGSLRCVKAIVKMQALVRKRRARLLLKRSNIEENLDEKNGINNHGSFMEKENTGTEPYTYTSIEKLLSNAFARQLLESTPKTKTINIKCDPSKSDSAWKWLERWMSVASVENGQSQKLEFAKDQQGKDDIVEADCQLETAVSSPENCQSRDIKSSAEALSLASEADNNVNTYDADSYNFQECRPTVSSVSHSHKQSHPQNVEQANLSNNTLESLPDDHRASDVCKAEPDSFHDQSEMERRQHVDVSERTAPEGSEIDGKKSSSVSRKASNPAFIAVQSKFEELSSAANLGKSVGLSNQDAGVDYSMDAVLPGTNHAFGAREIDHAESSIPQTSGIQVGGSECGTELSISSTLDSPDRSEVGVVDFEKETKSSEYGTENPKSSLNLEVDEKVESILSERDVSHSNSSQPEKQENSTAVESEHVSSIVTVESSEIEEKPDSIATGVLVEMESESSHPVSKSSPEASPRSHVTIPESHGTPSSQVSVKPKRIRSGKHGTKHKHGPVSTGKESQLEPNEDNGARSSSEHLSREHKAGKRRNSFGTAKTDHGDQEPRESSSSNSLPSYMQATESARAKALANNSPRSSPDTQYKDVYIKKRQSLSGSNTRQGSPRVQRSLSQAQQAAKGNGTHSPQERKWLR